MRWMGADTVLVLNKYSLELQQKLSIRVLVTVLVLTSITESTALEWRRGSIKVKDEITLTEV
jgi:hypothetical protein